MLTAWAAEKFNAEAITKSLENCGVKEVIGHKNLIIPGYVDIEETIDNAVRRELERRTIAPRPKNINAPCILMRIFIINI